MFSSNVQAERRAALKPSRRPGGPQALTLLCAFLHPALFGAGAYFKEQPIKAAYRKHPYKPTASAAPPPALPPASHQPHQTENVFIDALLQATFCQKHARPRPNLHLSSHVSSTYHKTRRRSIFSTGRQTRVLHHASIIRPAVTRGSPSREEYLNLVDTYRELYSTQAQWMDPTPPPLPPTLLYSPRSEIFLRPPTITNISIPRISMPVPVTHAIEEIESLALPVAHTESENESRKTIQASRDDPQQPAVQHLLRVLERRDCVHEDAFGAYSALPSPGVSHLSEPQIRLLLRRLSRVERKDRESALRYLSVVDDMKTMDFPMVEAEWNSAIAFCGQCFSHVRAAEVEDALITWKEMENEAGVKSSNVTFNILFDMAAKAGKFLLAGMILKEMEIRKLTYNRYFRVGNIYFNGLKGDGDGVRRAYRELVEAGEIVDTVVMNCVIAALLTAGELASAENVYDRMKRMLTTHTGRRLKIRSWQESRDLGRIFDRIARESRSDQRKNAARLALLKEEVSVVPNVHTYSIFIEHHAWTTGDLHRISVLLLEMQTLGVSVQGRIFLKLFKGFSRQGGQAYTAWTPSRLKSVWNRYLGALDDGHEDVRISKWLVIWAVRAFDQCAGREWAMHIWDELLSRWQPDNKELDSVRWRLRDILKVDAMGSHRKGR